MQEDVKRVFSLSQERDEYLICFLNGEIITTKRVEYALDVVNYPQHQLEHMYNFLCKQGFDRVTLVTHGVVGYDEDGRERTVEVPFQRTNVESMMKFIAQEFEEKENFDEK